MISERTLGSIQHAYNICVGNIRDKYAECITHEHLPGSLAHITRTADIKNRLAVKYHALIRNYFTYSRCLHMISERTA